MVTETSPSIQSLTAIDLERRLPVFTELLREVVNGGTSMGFLAPLSPGDGMDYWLSLRPELNAGKRVLLGAFVGNRLVGSGQLAFSQWQNAKHRAELQKLFVAKAVRGRGVGRALMSALHEKARQHGRSLVVLNTHRVSGAQEFYEELGYRVAGVVPGWTVGRIGERYDTVLMYQELSL